MLQNTIGAVDAILRTDQTVTQEERHGFIDTLRRGPDRRKTLPQVYTYTDAARALAVSNKRVYQLVRAGRLVGVSKTGGRCTGITEESLLALLNARKSNKLVDTEAVNE
jgi:hypothetical protein